MSINSLNAVARRAIFDGETARVQSKAVQADNTLGPADEKAKILLSNYAQSPTIMHLATGDTKLPVHLLDGV